MVKIIYPGEEITITARETLFLCDKLHLHRSLRAANKCEQIPQRKKPPMQNVERNKEIYNMRKNGETYASIGKKFDLSTARIREICLKIEYLIEAAEKMSTGDKDKKNTEVWKLDLSLRAFHALHGFNVFGDSYDYINWELNPKDILSVPNCGRKTIEEITDKLISLGYYKNIKEWYKENK